MPPAVIHFPPSVQTASISVLGGFAMSTQGATVSVCRASQRVLAYLAVRRRPVSRLRLCSTLWPDVVESRAFSSLRSALWKLTPLTSDVLEVTSDSIMLRANVATDLHIFDGISAALETVEGTSFDGSSVGLLRDDLLPDWYEDWVVMERERHTLRRLSALEKWAGACCVVGNLTAAADAALAVVHADPLRESGHAVLIDAYLRQGNVGLAVQQLRRYESLLREEFGIQIADGLRARIRSSVVEGDTVLSF